MDILCQYYYTTISNKCQSSFLLAAKLCARCYKTHMVYYATKHPQEFFCPLGKAFFVRLISAMRIYCFWKRKDVTFSNQIVSYHIEGFAFSFQLQDFRDSSFVSSGKQSAKRIVLLIEADRRRFRRVRAFYSHPAEQLIGKYRL